MTKPTVLMILDGWGLAPPGPGNAISLAKLLHIPRYWVSYPHGQLAASGEAVGLPAGEDGNTETGHLNLGAGRIVYQDLPRINMSIGDGSFFNNKAFSEALDFAKKNKSNLHFMGLIGEGGVHAKTEHIYALLEFVKQHQFNGQVYLHLFTDGRDSPPKAGLRLIHEVKQRCDAIGVGKIATIMGRYYAMDRDRRWERTEAAYQALTEEIKQRAETPEKAIENSYAGAVTDEFIVPTIILDPEGKPYPRITNGDAIIFFNFRIDRPRELTKAFVLSDFESEGSSAGFDPYAVKYYHKHLVEVDSRRKPFKRNIVLHNIFFVTMTEYEKGLPCTAAFPPEAIKMPIARVFAERDLQQLHISETEKERFVTYYFNGLKEEKFVGEDRVIVPSPKVATYDLAPEMSAPELTQKLIGRLKSDRYDFVVVNFANADMVAHTGNIPAAIRACETVDECVGKIVETVLTLDGTCVITADHGNVEEMLGPNGEVDTEHSTFPVPFIMIDHEFDNYPAKLAQGKLADVAPTILAHRKIPIPSDMTGKNLLIDLHAQRR